MPTIALPRQPNLDHLRKESRDLQRRARARDPEALALLDEYHPRGAASAPSLTLTSAQLAVARRYGFESWAKLREHVETINRYFWRPDEAAIDAGDPVDRFLALACLTWGERDDRRRPAAAAMLLEATPELATANVWAMAAANEGDALRAALAGNPALAHRPGGPHRWEPLLYAAYARIPGHSTLEAGRVLLDAGADPNAGSLWDGQYPFTALTGVLGGGENWPHQPRHPDGLAFARALLEAGANPNDTQAIYNRMFLPDNDHLELLFEYGLATGDPGPWAARLGPRATPIAAALQLDLQWAVQHGFLDRVRLLLDHGIDPNGDAGHPAMRGRLPYELAEAAGNRDIAELLVASGAERHELGSLERFVAACLRADRAEVEALRTDDLVARAQAEHEPVPQAAALGRHDAVRLMLDVGFDINAIGRGTALHEAAFAGNIELVRALIEWGADPSILDAEYNATALGWAHYAGHDEVAQYLASVHPGSS
jgi:ankyrin repeat protein